MSRLQDGDIVFIKSKNTKLLDQPKMDARAVAVLQPGDQVRWRGASEGGGKEFHRIEARGRAGHVLFSNLSTKFPAPQYLQGAGPSQVDCPKCIDGLETLPTTMPGQMKLRPCPACGGKGTVADAPAKAFASSGNATKA